MWRTVRCSRGDGYAESVDSWTQIADGVLQRRFDPLDVSVVAIVGATGISGSLQLPWPETVTRSAFEQGYAQLARAAR